MTKNKKEWVEPKLIVLVRNRPEEVVLVACKGYLGSGPSDTLQDCTGPPECGTDCSIPAAS